MSLLDQAFSAADFAEKNTVPDVTPNEIPSDQPDPKVRAVRTRKPAAPRAPRAKKVNKAEAEPAPPRTPSPQIENSPPRSPPPSLGQDFDDILSDKKPVKISAAADPTAPPKFLPVEGSRVEARKEQLYTRMMELQPAEGEEPSPDAEEELAHIFGELDELENLGGDHSDPLSDPFAGAPLLEPEDTAEREKLIAGIGAMAAIGDHDLPKGWQKKSSSDLRALLMQLKQEKQSSVVKNIVRRGYFSATAIVECVGPMATFLGEKGLECQGLTECLEGDSAVNEALDLVSIELEETYKEFMSPWTLLALATTAAVAKLHSTNRSVRLAAREIPPDLEARLKRIRPPAAQPAQPAQAPPQTSQQPAQPAAQTPAQNAQASVNAQTSLAAFRSAGFS